MSEDIITFAKCPICNVTIRPFTKKKEQKLQCKACKIKLGITKRGHIYIFKQGKSSLKNLTYEPRECPDCKAVIPPFEPNCGRYTICYECGLWIDNLDIEDSVMEDDSKYFCQKCEAMLPLVDPKEKYIKCQFCDFKISISVFKEETYTEYTFNKLKPPMSKNTDKSKKRLLGPMVDRICPKCSHEGMIYSTLQTRSVDEGQTVFYFCPDCGFQDMENS